MDYNNIAHRYDTLYEWWDFQKEDRCIWNLIWRVKWTIVDLWCWTWQWVKILWPNIWEYIWIDPSERMLGEAKRNFPEQWFMCWKIWDYPGNEKAKIVTWLFWVMNYLSSDEIETVLRVWEDMFMMDYVDWYHPLNYSISENPKRQFSPESFGLLYKWKLFWNYNIYSTRNLWVRVS